jgi:hypothetical protein
VNAGIVFYCSPQSLCFTSKGAKIATRMGHSKKILNIKNLINFTKIHFIFFKLTLVHCVNSLGYVALDEKDRMTLMVNQKECGRKWM